MSLNQPQPIQLRARLRAKRAAVNAEDRATASERICRALLEAERYRSAAVLGAYLPLDEEASPLAIIDDALTRNKTVCVPVIRQRRPPAMGFARLRSLSGLRENEFGILEPDASPDDFFPATELDLVLVPLVGFDSRGNRLGMGGGFYDRCFSFVRDTKNAERPELCGIAFDCQRVPELEAREWDVPLDCIVTESGLTDFRAD